MSAAELLHCEVPRKWYAVTYRGTAEMVCWVEASTVSEAKEKAESGEYDDASDIEFVRGRPYTLKAKPAPDFTPSDEYQA
jgi:hypothetical protein